MEKIRMLQFGQLPTEVCFAVVEEYDLCAEIIITLRMSLKIVIF